MTVVEGVPARRKPLIRLTYAIARREVRRVTGKSLLTPDIPVRAHRFGQLLGYAQLERSVARRPLVPERLRALAVLKSAVMQGCEMCQDIGSYEARAKGVDDGQLHDLHRYRDSDRFDETERLVLDLAVAMTRTPVVVAPELLEALARPARRRRGAGRARAPDRGREPALSLQRRVRTRRRRFQRGHGLRTDGDRRGGRRRAAAPAARPPERLDGAGRRARGRLVRVFLAGATGVIGRRLVPALLDAGHDVTAMCRSAERAEQARAAGAETAIADALDPGAVTQAVARARPDAVVNQLTALPKRIDPRRIERDFERNDRLRSEGSRILAGAARAAGVRRLLAQSIAFMYDAGPRGRAPLRGGPARARSPRVVRPHGERRQGARAEHSRGGRDGAPLRLLLRAGQRDRARRLDRRRPPAPAPPDRRLGGGRVVVRARRRRCGRHGRGARCGPRPSTTSSMTSRPRPPNGCRRSRGPPAPLARCGSRRSWRASRPASTASPS